MLYWHGPEDLTSKIVDTIVADMEADTGQSLDPEKPYVLWRTAAQDEDGKQRAEYLQVLSPYRGEQFRDRELEQGHPVPHPPT